MGVSLTGGAPISHLEMSIFSRKTPWLLGTSIFSKPPYPSSPGSFMRKALTTTSIFFAGKTVEGVGKTPGSCSKTQDFQFTTPETWPSFATLKAFGDFCGSNHSLMSSVWVCFVGLRFVLFAKKWMMPQLKTYKLHIHCISEASKHLVRYLDPKNIPKQRLLSRYLEDEQST